MAKGYGQEDCPVARALDCRSGDAVVLLRRLLLAIVRDLRVVPVLLAEAVAAERLPLDEEFNAMIAEMAAAE